MLFNWNVGTNTFQTVPCALAFRIVLYLDLALGFWVLSLDVKFSLFFLKINEVLSLLAGFWANILLYFSRV
jgi:hypothetical protein